MKKLIAASFTAAALILPLSAVAEYPEKPVEFIVPFPPGDLEDVLTRLIADQFQADYGVPAAVVNKPGGGGGPYPGAAFVANAKPDGYTVGSFVIDVPVVGPTVGIPTLKPNPFEPVGIFLTYPSVIATSKESPYNTMAELAEYAKTHDIALGHFGSYLIPTQVALALAKQMGFEYGNDTAFDALDCNTLASGDADVINTTIQLIQPCLDKVTVLASISGKRINLIPDTPTVGELDPQLDVALWNGLFIHKDTPKDVREKIAKTAEKVMLSQKAQNISKETGALIYWQDAKTSKARIQKDNETLKTITKVIEE